MIFHQYKNNDILSTYFAIQHFSVPKKSTVTLQLLLLEKP